MKKTGRPPVLNADKKREILAILSVGCRRRVAAAYVGCTVATIRNTARRDPDFARQLSHAENKAEVVYLTNIRKAAEKEQYWRAAAWALERINPEDYVLRRPGTVTVDQLENLLAQVAKTILAPIADVQVREQILSRLEALIASLAQPALPESPNES
jgi:hypothetical protein